MKTFIIMGLPHGCGLLRKAIADICFQVPREELSKQEKITAGA